MPEPPTQNEELRELRRHLRDELGAWASLRKAARYLGMSHTTLARLAEANQVKAYRLGEKTIRLGTRGGLQPPRRPGSTSMWAGPLLAGFGTPLAVNQTPDWKERGPDAGLLSGPQGNIAQDVDGGLPECDSSSDTVSGI